MLKAAIAEMERLGLQGLRISCQRQMRDRIYREQVSSSQISTRYETLSEMLFCKNEMCEVTSWSDNELYWGSWLSTTTKFISSYLVVLMFIITSRFVIISSSDDENVFNYVYSHKIDKSNVLTLDLLSLCKFLTNCINNNIEVPHIRKRSIDCTPNVS